VYSQKRKSGPKSKLDAGVPCSPTICFNGDTDFDPTILSICISQLECIFPIINTADIIVALSYLQGEIQADSTDIYTVEHACACQASLWACMSLGSFFLGNDSAGRKLADKAKNYENICKLSHLPAVARAEILLALVFQWAGSKLDAVYYLKQAENVCDELHELKGCAKVVRLWILPFSTAFENLEYLQFEQNEMQLLPLEAKIVYSWSVQFIMNVFLSGKTWAHAIECYHNLLLAETSLFQKDQPSFTSFFLVQSRLIILEISQLSMVRESLGRAHALVDFFWKEKENLSILVNFSACRENASIKIVLELLAQIYHVLKNAELYQKVQMIWLHICPENSTAFPSIQERWVGKGSSLAIKQ